MSKLRTDSIDPHLGASVEIGGLNPPTHQGVPLAPVASPSFTGLPSAPTQGDSDNSTHLATTAFVRTRSTAAVVERLSDAPPLMDGSAVAGVSVNVSRADHSHPSDTSRASDQELNNQMAASFRFLVPGTYTNVFTAPRDGWIKALVIGAGGGGGGGGKDLSGNNGTPGLVHEFFVGAPAGSVFTVIVGAGGAGAPSGPNPLAPPAATGGGSSSLLLNGGTIGFGLGGGPGTSVSSHGALTGPSRSIFYHANDAGDSRGGEVAIGASASSYITSQGGIAALNGFPTDILWMTLSGNPGALNGLSGTTGGGGAGAAPTGMFIPSRGFFADPVDGDGGDCAPTSAGGNGGTGLVYFEFRSSGSVSVGSGPQVNGVGYATLDLLKRELIAQGLTITL